MTVFASRVIPMFFPSVITTWIHKKKRKYWHCKGTLCKHGHPSWPQPLTTGKYAAVDRHRWLLAVHATATYLPNAACCERIAWMLGCSASASDSAREITSKDSNAAYLQLETYEWNRGKATCYPPSWSIFWEKHSCGGGWASAACMCTTVLGRSFQDQTYPFSIAYRTKTHKI